MDLNLRAWMNLKNNGGVFMENRKNKVNRMLEMPIEVYSNEPKITLNSFEEMIIENYKGILEYEENFAKINTYIGIINIHGINLKLQEMTDENIKILGLIDSIDIEREIG
ncbi:YabP family protein [compost metagenome]